MRITKQLQRSFAIGLLIAVLANVSGFLAPQAAAATCANASVELIFRDPNNAVAENISWSLHKQERTVDAVRYLGRSVRSGRTNESGSVAFELNPFSVVSESKRGGSNVFAVKAYDLNGNEGEHIFWDVIIGCGNRVSESFVLSTLTTVIRDQNGVPITNQPFSIYTQKYSIDGTKIADKLVKNNVSTGTSGYVTVHLAPGAYVITVPTPSNRSKSYSATDVIVRGERQNTFDYRTGNLHVSVTDSAGNPVANVSVDIYSQTTGFDGLPKADKREATSRTDSNGVAAFFQPEGTYALQVNGPNRSAYQFFNVRIVDESNSSITKKLSTVTVFARNEQGVLAKNIRMSLHAQQINSDGVALKGDHIQTITSNDTGVATFYVAPGTYVFSAGDTNRYSIVVRDGETTSLTYQVPAKPGKTDTKEEVLVKGVTFDAIPNGSVVKAPSNNHVYFIEKGKKREIPDEATFFAYGFTWPQVYTISDTELAAYPLGTPLPMLPVQSLGEGSIVKSDRSPAVYRIENGTKRVFVDAYSFTSLGYRFSNVRVVTTFVLDQYPDGEKIFVPVGPQSELIKAENVATVYKLEHGLKRPFANEQSFIGRGYSWDEVRTISFEEVRTIPLGAPIE